MGSQRDMFLEFEADAFHARNRVDGPALDRRIEEDLVLESLRSVALEPARVLEIGASNGWRLDALCRRMPRAFAVGVDPSRRALADGAKQFPRVQLLCGTAERLPFADRSFDLVILGFCLYVVDRDDLFRVAAEVDRVVTGEGVVAILDFHVEAPVRRPYRDRPDCYSFKMDYAAMLAWNPVYRRIYRGFATHPGGRDDAPEDRIAVTLLERDPEVAYRDERVREEDARAEGSAR